MCDMSQFIGIVLIPSCTSAIVSKFFMQDILFKFELLSLFIIDYGIRFQGILLVCVNPYILRMKLLRNGITKVFQFK